MLGPSTHPEKNAKWSLGEKIGVVLIGIGQPINTYGFL